MAYDNSGTLARVAQDQRKSEKSPEYEGEFNCTCPQCGASTSGWLKAWVKEGKAGKFFSLAFKFKTRSGAAS